MIAIGIIGLVLLFFGVVALGGIGATLKTFVTAYLESQQTQEYYRDVDLDAMAEEKLPPSGPQGLTRLYTEE